MAKAICICGKICSGKSTYAERLRREQRAVVLSVDEIMLRLFGLYAGDRHDEYAAKCQDYLLDKAAEIADSGVNVILDWGFWTKSGREKARRFFAARHIPCEFHYLNVGEAAWQQRLNQRNAAVAAGKIIAYPVDENLAAKFAARFEAPDRAEMDVWVDDQPD